jgi:predicted metal-dependent hydrolase
VKVWKKQEGKSVRPKQGYGRGDVFMYQGNELRLEFTMSPRHSVHLHEGLLLLSAPEVPSDDSVRKLILSWYRRQAHRLVAERSMACHHIMQNEQIPLPPITFRFMKTRWGSYSYRTKRIALNINLIKAPPECLDYVIIHEFCHIKIRHHGPDFWQMVSRYCPDYLAERSLLKQYTST